MAARADEALRPEQAKQDGEPLNRDKRSFIQKHANRAAETWILGHIHKQWKKPGLYTQNTTKAALARSLDEMEARTWQLQQKVKELERDSKIRRRRLRQLKSSRSWRLVNMISNVTARIAGR